jgi:glutamate racemase
VQNEAMPSSALGDVLVTLADAQELAEQLPPLSPDHETVVLVVTNMKVLHHELTGRSGQTVLVINHSRATVAQAREVLAAVRHRSSRSSG